MPKTTPLVKRAAFLRAVNLGPHGKVPMAKLRASLEARGYASVATLLASGNVVLAAPADDAALERAMEALLKDEFGLTTPVMVRSAEALESALARNPFQQQAQREPAKVACVFLKKAPDASAESALRAAIVGAEQIALGDRVLYAYYADGIGNSKLTPALIDRKLGVPGTARNVTTVGKTVAALRA
jgi:uncharacterized protein (DUF1697 family)